MVTVTQGTDSYSDKVPRKQPLPATNNRRRPVPRLQTGLVIIRSSDSDGGRERQDCIRLGLLGSSGLPVHVQGMSETKQPNLSKKELKKLQFFQRLKKKKPSIKPGNGEDLNSGSKKRKRIGEHEEKNGFKKKAKTKSKGKSLKVENQIYIGGLPYKFSEDDVKAIFQTCGNIKSVHLPINKHGKPTGFGFIVFESSDSIQKALAFDGHELDGRFIQVETSPYFHWHFFMN